MFLIVVANLDIRTKGESSVVCRENLIKNLKQSRLAGSIIADDRNVFATLDLKTDI